MPRSENPMRFLGYWMVSRCNRCRWLVTPATAMVGFAICRRTGDITAYIPVHPKQETSMASSGDFTYHADHLICPQGKTLRRGAYPKRQRSYQHVARQNDC